MILLLFRVKVQLPGDFHNIDEILGAASGQEAAVIAVKMFASRTKNNPSAYEGWSDESLVRFLKPTVEYLKGAIGRDRLY